MFVIAKEFGLDYGHRVWTQKLNEIYSLDSACVCRHLHGHRATIKVYLESDSLDESGMVTDFKHLNWFKKFLDDVLDHKFIMDLNDPLRRHVYPTSMQPANLYYDARGYYTIHPDVLNNLQFEMKELYEGVIFVPFVPTSELLSKWLFELVSSYMSLIHIKVSRIQFFETPKSQSNYYAEDSH